MSKNLVCDRLKMIFARYHYLVLNEQIVFLRVKKQDTNCIILVITCHTWPLHTIWIIPTQTIFDHFIPFDRFIPFNHYIPFDQHRPHSTVEYHLTITYHLSARFSGQNMGRVRTLLFTEAIVFVCRCQVGSSRDLTIGKGQLDSVCPAS